MNEYEKYDLCYSIENKKCISSYKLGEYLDFLYKKEISEFCLDDKKYYEFMSKSTLIPL